MNVPADEYVAVFAVTEEGKTPEEAGTKMDATIAAFKKSLAALGVKTPDLFVDFVIQNRIYAYRLENGAPRQAVPREEGGAGPFNLKNSGFDNVVREELTGFELKKNVSIRFTDKLQLDKFAAAAARLKIYDLVKVDYIVKNLATLQANLQTQTMALIKQKTARYEAGLGIELAPMTRILADMPSVYFPVEQYDNYQAAEGDNISLPYDSKIATFRARKTRTTFFNPLSGAGFDTVINPVIIEPVVQLTTYIKVQYGDVVDRPVAERTGFGGG